MHKTTVPLDHLRQADYPGSLFPPGLAARQFGYAPGSGVVYLQNPKVGCTSIRESLWRRADALAGRLTYSGDPYAATDSPFCRSLAEIEASGLDAFLASSVFSVVRNPYVRVLSAYLDKVASPERDMRVWRQLVARYGWDIKSVPPFADVLAAVSGDDPLAVDHHFRPQHLNLMHSRVFPDFIGRIERMDEVAAYLEGRGVVLAHAASHGTSADKKLAAYFGPVELKLARSIYARDFEIYGYSPDLNAPPPLAPVVCEAADKEALHDFFRSQRDVPAPVKRKRHKPIVRAPYWKVPWRVVKRTGVVLASRNRPKR